MWSKIIILLFFSILTSEFAFAQTIPAKTDSSQIYKNIESYSKRRRFTNFMYPLIFKPVAKSPQKKGVKKKVNKNLIQKPYSAFEGKIIRHINITTMDPFGHSVADTNVIVQNYIFRAGNKLHVKSLHITIRNLLLIRQNQQFDSLLVKESERLVRSRGYVHDVSFFVTAISKKSDSVDIFIRVLDNWSLIPGAAASASQMTINLSDKNFLGSGHEFQNNFSWHHAIGEYAYYTNYYIPNIRNTFINTTLHFGTDEFGNYSKSFAVDRPFFSPFAKWAAGIIVASQFKKDSLKDIQSVYFPFHLKFRTQDLWAGTAYQLFKGNTEEERTTNLILTARFLRVRYFEKAPELYDPLHIFSSEDFYLGGIGISTRKYVQDKYIFKQGIIEDVPVGKVYALTGGYQVKNNSGRLYLGLRFSFGNYYERGYLSSNFECGTFLNKSHVEQGVFTASVNYFTRLVEIGKWKLRQFVKPQVTIGINRFSYDSITLNDGYGLDGFNSPALSGTSRILFTMQTQSYSPWKFIGFRFGPYLIYSFGMLGNTVNGFKNTKVYSQIVLGVLIKNENLVINTFQFSISFYPIIPGTGQNIFKINSFKTTDFGFRDFEIGKPAIIGYQ